MLNKFDIFASDLRAILPEYFFYAYQKRPCLSNSSSKVVFDSATTTELTLLTLQMDNKDLHVNAFIEFKGITYQIYEIQKESRVLLRLFLRDWYADKELEDWYVDKK